MATENIAVTYSNDIAGEIGIVVDTTGIVTVGINSSYPTEVIKLLQLLDAARNVIVQQYATANNPEATNIAMRGAPGF